MSSWTEEQIQTLAPDASSLKAGKDLATLRKWPLLAVNERVLWGEVQGSGKDPYRTQVDLTQIAFKCSCPSRKFPCKHGLGLLFLYSRETAQFRTDADEPAWVSDWMDKRVAKAGKPPKEPAPEPARPKPRRLDDRLDAIRAGAGELDRWLADLLRTGLLTLADKTPAYWQTLAARLVDAKAPGLAARIRTLSDLPFSQSGARWHDPALQQLAELYLLTQAVQRLDQLPADLQEDVKSLVGISLPQKELLARPGLETLRDEFSVLARHTTTEDDLTVQRNYLYGRQSGRYALILNFGFRGAPIPTLLVPGTAVEATLVFYPGRRAYRAVVQEQGSTRPIPNAPTGLADWAAAQQDLTDALARLPWTDELPQTVAALRVVPHNDRFYLKDARNRSLPLPADWPLRSFYQLMALTGGHPHALSLLRTGDGVRPLGVWLHESYYALS